MEREEGEGKRTKQWNKSVLIQGKYCCDKIGNVVVSFDVALNGEAFKLRPYYKRKTLIVFMVIIFSLAVK